MKQMLKRQLKQLPEEQQQQILTVVEKNPELFEKIAKKVQERVKEKGEDQQTAAMAVFQQHQSELKQVLKGTGLDKQQ